MKVLLCIRDDIILQRACSAIRDMGLEPIGETTAEGALARVGESDVLILDWDVVGLQALLDFWRQAKTGPIAIMYEAMPDAAQVKLLSERLIWNVFPCPIDERSLRAIIITLLVRYTS